MAYIPQMLPTPPNASKDERLEVAIHNTTALLKYSWPISESNKRRLLTFLQKLYWQCDNMDQELSGDIRVGDPVWYAWVPYPLFYYTDPIAAVVVEHIEKRWWRKEKFVIRLDHAKTLKVEPYQIWPREVPYENPRIANRASGAETRRPILG